MKKTLIKVDRNGTKYFMVDRPCDRCGGAGGADAWAYTGYTCYKCGGTGQGGSEIVKEYTPEYEAKLEARRQARAAKWEAEHAEEIAKQKAEAEAKRQAEEARKAEEEARIKAEKAISQYIGNIGDKVETRAVYLYSAHFEIRSFGGYGFETMYIHGFKDAAGNKLVWKTSKHLSIRQDKEVTIRGTVKEHSEYKDEKQTVLTRCKITE